MRRCVLPLAAGLYGDIVGHSDFQLNLQSPGTGGALLPTPAAAEAIVCARREHAGCGNFIESASGGFWIVSPPYDWRNHL